MVAPSVLVVDDEPYALFGICQILKDEGFNAIAAESAKKALEKLRTTPINLVITDERMPDLSGTELLSEIKKIDRQIPVILITAYGSVSMAVEALRKGAFYFFEKPIFNNLEQFITILRQALKAQEMEKEIDHLRKEVGEKYSFPNIVSNHSKMLEIFEIIGKLSKSDKTILIQGESGTGKGLIAKTIHYNSLRKDKPLIILNCGTLTESLLISELFGHTRGSFTGAVVDKIGRFQMADGGTLVLDEIGEFPFHLQKTLLEVIEEKDFLRIGDSKYTKVDVRIISTTNRNLKEEVGKGNFREDLYYRLGIIPLTIPPLRERTSDIPLLVKHCLGKYQEGNLPVRIEPEVLDRLQTYPWPGNVRELNNVIQQMMIFCSNNTIMMNDLPPSLFLKEQRFHTEMGGKIHLTKMVEDLERRWILHKLKETKWNQEKTARVLGITRKMLTNRMEKYKLKTIRNKLL